MWIARRLGDWFERMFPERQIYHRSGGTVRYISVAPLNQLLIALAALAVVGVGTFSTGKLAIDWVAGLFPSEGRTIAATGSEEVSALRSRVSELERSLAAERQDNALLRSKLNDGNRASFPSWPAIDLKIPSLQWDFVGWTRSMYRNYKALIRTLEPENSLTPGQQLSAFLDLVGAIFYAFFGGVGAVVGLAFTRIFLRVKRSVES